MSRHIKPTRYQWLARLRRDGKMKKDKKYTRVYQSNPACLGTVPVPL